MKNWMTKLAILLCATCSLLACSDTEETILPVLKLNKTTLSLKKGASETLVATLTPAATAPKYIWSSDNDKVATVTDGLVQAVGLGKATIKVSTSGVTASCEVTVSEIEVTGITLNKNTLALSVEGTETLIATLEPAHAAGTVSWSSNADAVATVSEGLVTAIAPGVASITATANGFSASCEVTVSAIPVTGISLNKTTLTLKIGETETLIATVTPENAGDKHVSWYSNNVAVATVADGLVTAVSSGNVTITAEAGAFSATCAVVITADPKIGDYFYADGTWSDGGLISIDPSGLNPVWKSTKPAPIAGKELIGIIFQTHSDRIAASDKAKGFTHGYVMAVKNAHGTDKKTTWYSSDYNFSCLKPAKTSDVWFWNINGYNDTMTVKEKYGASITSCPAFDWTINGFGLTASANSSGWFMPSTGQAWDMIANLCGHEVAVIMKDWEQKKLNVGYGDASSKAVSYDVIAKFNESMSMIPAANKEDMFVTSSEFHSLCTIWTSTPYSAGETASVINIGTKGLIELYEEYIDYDAVARPILAF
ncbi:MAG: Ig-like domain-containing protein [Alistipes sp.]